MTQCELRMQSKTSKKVREFPYTIAAKGCEPLFISHTKLRNCSPLSRLPPDRGVSEYPWAGRNAWETSVAVKAAACAGTRLSCPSQGTRNARSAVHPSAVPHPVSRSCVWAGWQQRGSYCAVWKGCLFQNTWLPRSIERNDSAEKYH